MGQLTCVLNGKIYLLMEVGIVDIADAHHIDLTMKKYDCLYQGLNYIRVSFFRFKCVIKVLVPQENIVEFTSNI